VGLPTGCAELPTAVVGLPSGCPELPTACVGLPPAGTGLPTPGVAVAAVVAPLVACVAPVAPREAVRDGAGETPVGALDRAGMAVLDPVVVSPVTADVIRNCGSAVVVDTLVASVASAGEAITSPTRPAGTHSVPVRFSCGLSTCSQSPLRPTTVKVKPLS